MASGRRLCLPYRALITVRVEIDLGRPTTANNNGIRPRHGAVLNQRQMALIKG